MIPQINRTVFNYSVAVAVVLNLILVSITGFSLADSVFLWLCTLIFPQYIAARKEKRDAMPAAGEIIEVQSKVATVEFYDYIERDVV